MLAALLAAAVTLTIPEPPKLDVERMLAAIVAVEAWDGKSTGAAGEYGAYQITPAVWKLTRIGSTRTMRQATPSEHHAAAREELLFRIAALQMNHVRITPTSAALAWCAGVSATINGTASKVKLAYAERAENLYRDAQKTKP